MKVIITGASRGIGLELTRVALQKGFSVLATARAAQATPELKELGDQFAGRLKLANVDLEDPRAAEQITAEASHFHYVDFLFNNAGVFLKEEEPSAFHKAFQVNAIMPFFITKALLPKLQKSKNPKVIQTTSRMGSISDNTSGGCVSYRASKSALNMINKSLAVDHNWMTSIVIHPGWVQTEMGGAGAPVPSSDSAAGIWKVAEKITLQDSGRFYDFQGEILPW